MSYLQYSAMYGQDVSPISYPPPGGYQRSGAGGGGSGYNTQSLAAAAAQDRPFMSALSQLHGGPTAEERYLAEMKRRELVDALGMYLRPFVAFVVRCGCASWLPVYFSCGINRMVVLLGVDQQVREKQARQQRERELQAERERLEGLEAVKQRQQQTHEQHQHQQLMAAMARGAVPSAVHESPVRKVCVAFLRLLAWCIGLGFRLF